MSAPAMIAKRVTEFWRLIDVKSSHECWPWLGHTEKGYGRFYWDSRMMGAHELALSFTTGEVRAPQLDTCHSCNNPICCNPSHLRFDTRLSNVRDAIEAGTELGPPPKAPDEVVKEIRERRENGAAQKDLAAIYGYSRGYISELVRGVVRPEAGGPIQTKRAYRRSEGVSA